MADLFTIKNTHNPADEIPSIINIGEEDQLAELQEIANKEGAVLLAFVSPYAGIRISPIERRFATIGLHEEFGIENVLEEIQRKIEGKVRKLFFLVNTPGGSASSSYKIAHILQHNFNDIHVFVPHLAASGGTLLAMVGKKITLGMIGNLTPVDVQLRYKNTIVSATSIMKAFWRLQKGFSDKLPQEAPYPLRAMADKLDPIIYEEWSSALEEISSYAREILSEAGYTEEEIKKIITEIVYNDYTHGYVINHKKAANLGFHLDNSAQTMEYLKIMRIWLGCYALKAEGRHFIRYVLPKIENNKLLSVNNINNNLKK